MTIQQQLTRTSSAIVGLARLAQRKHRDQRREFLAEGKQAVSQALATGAASALYGTPDSLTEHAELLAQAVAKRLPVRSVTADGMALFSQTVTPQNLVAVCGFIDLELDRVLESTPKLVVVLDQIRDPGNAGTILRTADAAGTDAVIFSDASVDPYNGKCVRASVGSIFHPAVVRGGAAQEIVAQLRHDGLQILATDATAKTSLYDMADRGELRGPTAWLFGNEARGLEPDLLRQADRSVAVPIYGAAESLNLATAVALCLYASAQSLSTKGQ
ncbi:MAG: TrmH family RNA methyltransferase [Mycobacteriales bacterium]